MRVRGGPAAALLATAFAAMSPPALAAPDCSPFPKSRTILQTNRFLEAIYMDDRQRLFYSDEDGGGLMRLDRLDGKPRKLATVVGPGGIVQLDDGSIVVGYGDTPRNGVEGDRNPTAGLLRVDPDTGARSVYATGLGMANGVALGPDGAIYATNDFGQLVDRVKDGKVSHGWAELTSGNGLVVSRDNRYVYVAQTFVPAAIQRITVAKPSEVEPYVEAGPADKAAGLDGMTQDGRGNLYAAANGSGEVWKVDTNRRICVLARGLSNPSAVAFGTGRYARNLYVTTFGGQIVELSAVRPQPRPRPGSGPGRSPDPAPGTRRRGAKGTLVGRVGGAPRGRRVRVTVRRGGRVLRRTGSRRFRFRLRARRHYRVRVRAGRDLRCRDRIVFVKPLRTARVRLRCHPRR